MDDYNDKEFIKKIINADAISDDAIKEFTLNSHHYRGIIINEFAMLEKAIEGFILKYLNVLELCGYDMQIIILDRLTFEAKRASLKKLLDDQARADGFIPTNKNKSPYKDFMNELVSLNEQRNIFAHYPMEISKHIDASVLDDYVICLQKYRDGYESIRYTQEEIDKILTRIRNAVIELESILSKVDSPYNNASIKWDSKKFKKQ